VDRTSSARKKSWREMKMREWPPTLVSSATYLV
jgi:hypothetical protein